MCLAVQARNCCAYGGVFCKVEFMRPTACCGVAVYDSVTAVACLAVGIAMLLGGKGPEG